MKPLQAFFWVPLEHQPLLRELGLTESEQIFTDPRIVPWRSIPERDNCTFDATLGDGQPIRLHIKRYQPMWAPKPPAELEADGMLSLQLAKIPTAPLIAWGKMADGRSFLITRDLAGYRPADKIIQSGTPFARLLESTADLAARLHTAELHHRDLYLCHFLVKFNSELADLKLIDAGRVRRMPGWPFRNRWIVKDVAQFCYSAAQLKVPADQLDRWLERYARQRKLETVDSLRRAVQRKVAWIAKHDAKLQAKQPNRNVSLPGT
ncbi:MAG TPA: lipopolysaccharide kinase InaA family protein [Tepidisphaeraceae bacterium]|nr:lipopolysaccharide kinase InaA family protein [Tepidisphaeraceae bacterium]